MNRKLQVIKYLLADIVAASSAWALFYAYRKLNIEKAILQFDERFVFGIIAIPMFWVILYTITGTYKTIYRKSRLKELGQTIFISIIGVIFIFFALLLDCDCHVAKV